jgi:hypothetical protein
MAEATACVQRCGLDIYTSKPETYWIDCRIRYLVGAEEIVTKIHSRNTPAPRRVISKHPGIQIGLMQEWVDQHPTRRPIAVHYDPADHSKAVLVVTDMPPGGQRTPDNLKLLGVTAAFFALLLAIAVIAKSSSNGVGTVSQLPT